MARFKCTNNKCPNIDKPIIVAKVSFIFDNKLKKLIVRNKQYCASCGNELEYIEEQAKSGIEGFCFTRFNTLSSDDKKAAMKKRSQKMFDKKEKKDMVEYKKQIIRDNRRMAEGRM